MADDTAVEREITVPVEPEHAWELVTDPEHLERWFADHVELDPTPGAPVRVVDGDGGERHGIVEEVDAPRRLRFTWYAPPDGPPSSVEIEVAPDAGGSRISVTERELVTIDAVGPLTVEHIASPGDLLALAA
ncbi:MAG TPA: SRPBCC family protein [Gaiellales bacterium]|nr:SRPBCC family protein [Gaiellales bacterium]